MFFGTKADSNQRTLSSTILKNSTWEPFFYLKLEQKMPLMRNHETGPISHLRPCLKLTFKCLILIQMVHSLQMFTHVLELISFSVVSYSKVIGSTYDAARRGRHWRIWGLWELDFLLLWHLFPVSVDTEPIWCLHGTSVLPLMKLSSELAKKQTTLGWEDAKKSQKRCLTAL